MDGRRNWNRLLVNKACCLKVLRTFDCRLLYCPLASRFHLPAVPWSVPFHSMKEGESIDHAHSRSRLPPLSCVTQTHNSIRRGRRPSAQLSQIGKAAKGSGGQHQRAKPVAHIKLVSFPVPHFLPRMPPRTETVRKKNEKLLRKHDGEPLLTVLLLIEVKFCS